MSDSYGKKVAKAFEAIYQLHTDASKLLSDCDGTIGKGKTPVHGSYVMKDLSKAVYNPDEWMPYAVYRYYDATVETSGLVDGVMLYFWDYPPHPDEPMLILGRMQYRLEGGEGIKSVCKAWDLWSTAFDWSEDRSIGKVISLQHVDNGRIEWVRFTITPLYSIKSMEDVVCLMHSLCQVAP